MAELSPLMPGVLGFVPAYAIWPLWFTITACVGFLVVLAFPPTFLIYIIFPSIIHSS